MAWCGCSRKGRQCLASSGGGAAGWSVSTSTPYIPWQRRFNKALQPFSGGVYGWVFCAKDWQLQPHTVLRPGQVGEGACVVTMDAPRWRGAERTGRADLGRLHGEGDLRRGVVDLAGFEMQQGRIG